MVNPRKKPKFLRQSSIAYKRLGKKWRKPRGEHSKLRRLEKGKGKVPSPSYGAPKELRYLHPSGLNEVLVFNIRDLEKINSVKDAAKIARTVGNKKRKEIIKKAEEMKIRILNPR